MRCSTVKGRAMNAFPGKPSLKRARLLNPATRAYVSRTRQYFINRNSTPQSKRPSSLRQTGTPRQPPSDAMPLSSGPGVQHFVQNRESATSHANLVTRSITPQPQKQSRERSRQKHAQGGRHARSNSHNGASSKKELFRQDPESLKLQVPNTLRKTVSGIPQTESINTARGSSSNPVAKTRASRQVREKASQELL